MLFDWKFYFFFLRAFFVVKKPKYGSQRIRNESGKKPNRKTYQSSSLNISMAKNSSNTGTDYYAGDNDCNVKNSKAHKVKESHIIYFIKAAREKPVSFQQA